MNMTGGHTESGIAANEAAAALPQKEKVRAGQPYLYRADGLPSEVYEVRFKEILDHADVDAALQKAIARYPYFKVRYAEEAGDFFAVPNESPMVAYHTADMIPLGGAESNFYLIAVSHFENRLDVAFHHGLTDGRGIKTFVETLVAYYCKIHYGTAEIPDGVLTDETPFTLEEIAEPCGEKRAVDKKKLSKVTGLSKKAFAIPETKNPPAPHRRYELKFPQDEFMATCKKYGASPIILLSVLTSRAIHAASPDNTQTINSNFPVDARAELGVPKTYKNCVKSLSLPYGEHEKSLSTQELCAYYRTLLKAQRNPEHCKAEFNNIIMLLDVLNHLHSYQGKRKIMRFLDDLRLNTYIISYIGQFTFGKNEAYVDSVHLFSDCSNGITLNMTCECGFFFIDFVQDFENPRYMEELAAQFGKEGLTLSCSEKIEFCTPKDHLMRDMPRVPAAEEEKTDALTWLKVCTLALRAYKNIERATVGAANSITDGFVKAFLLKDGETVQEARHRLEEENRQRMEKQEARLMELNRNNPSSPYNPQSEAYKRRHKND